MNDLISTVGSLRRNHRQRIYHWDARSKEALMHDWTLVSILFEWKSGGATLEFRTDASKSATLTAHGVSELHIPRLNEWGPSVSVSEVFGPTDRGSGRRELEIEMQSGDRIRIVAASFDFPPAADNQERQVYAPAVRN
jgi:hypothetical protein